MKKALLLLIIFVTGSSLFAQPSINRVMSDENMKEYVWAIGYGETLEQADKDAMNTLANYAVNLTATSNLSISNTVSSNKAISKEEYLGEMSTVSNMYLDNMRREILPERNNMMRVLRYMTRDDWDSRHEALKSKIEEYIESGKYAALVEDKIRYYTWAHILIQTYPSSAEPIMVGSQYAKQWLYEELRCILDDIKISVIGIQHDKTDTKYPYRLFLDFIYNGEPISYLQYSYFDGTGYVENESVKDGRSVIQIKRLEPEVNINIDCLNKDLARQIEPSVSVLLENNQYSSSFEEGQKQVPTQKDDLKPQKKIETAIGKVESEVNTQLAKTHNSYVEFKDGVSSEREFIKIMEDITDAITKPKSTDIRGHFTDEAWLQYQNIVAHGCPILARTPEFKFIKHDSLTICHSLPLKLRFAGNRSFVEDVVFRVNNRTFKVESVAYKLSTKTESSIMSMGWDDAARLTLITFLEDYRSAYCLKNLEYINKVFADDAYIIVGTVLKESGRRFKDMPQAAEGSTTVYTRKSKEQYISDLRKSFISKEFINLRFEDCNVARGYGAKTGIYAVQVNQLYYSNNYADNGILTLAIDMREGTNPLVRVRVWQQAIDVKYTAEEMIERTVSVDNDI